MDVDAEPVPGGMTIPSKSGILKQCTGCNAPSVFACDEMKVCSPCESWDIIQRETKDYSIEDELKKAKNEAGGDVGCNTQSAGPGGFAQNACCFFGRKDQQCEKRFAMTEGEWRKAREKFVAELDTSDPTKCPPSTGQACSAFNALGNMFQGQGGDGCHSDLHAQCDESDKMCKCLPGSCFNGKNKCVEPMKLAEKFIGSIPY